MAATYAKYSGLGGGGGAAGDVTGPASSVQFSTPVFADTTGKVLIDSQTSKTMLVPIGDLVDGGGVLGIQFHGTGTDNTVPAKTGFKALLQNGSLYMQHILDGKQIFTTSTTVSDSPTDIAIQADQLRPDNVNGTLGTTTHRWAHVYTNSVSVPSTVGRAIVLGNLSDSSLTGIGMDAAGFGREIYFQVDAGSAYIDYFNAKCLSPFSTTIVSAPDETTVNSTKAVDLVFKGANKVAGTGNGGNTVMGVGTSAGGTPGHFYIPCEAGAPSTTPVAITGQIAMQFDSTNNMLYAYLNGAWKAVILV